MGDNLTDFFFTSNLTRWQCSSNIALYFSCTPPNACAHNPSTGQAYCCSTQSQENGCWTEGTSCQTDGSTSTCGGEDKTSPFCCFAQEQTCTQKLGELNVCWKNGTNPLTNISETQLNSTFSSLSSAHPSASTFAFNPLMLESSTTSSAIPTNASTSEKHSHGSSLPSGSIAGIIVGAIFGPVLIMATIFIFGRKRFMKMIARAREQQGSLDWTLARRNRKVVEADSGMRPELDGKEVPAELANNVVAHELPGRYA